MTWRELTKMIFFSPSQMQELEDTPYWAGSPGWEEEAGLCIEGD